MPYDLDNLEDKNIHLTNWAVQKKADNYGADEDANQMNFLQFQVQTIDGCVSTACTTGLFDWSTGKARVVCDTTVRLVRNI